MPHHEELDAGRGYWAGHQDGCYEERRKTRATKQRMIYFLGVAIDYMKLIDGTNDMVARMESFRKELREDV